MTPPPLLPLSSPPRRVLIVRMSHLGDIAQTLPLLHGVREAWPEAAVAWAAQPEFAGLVEPLVDRVVPFERRGGARAWPRIRRAMRDFGPDLAIDAQGNWKSAAATRLSGAPIRLTLPRAGRQEPFAARAFGLAEVGLKAHPRHLVPLCQDLAAAITGARPARVDPMLDAAEFEEGRRAWAALTTGAGAVILHPGVAGDPRSWSEDRFRALGQRLLDTGRPLAVVTGPAEEVVGQALREHLPRASHLVGQRGLRALAALLTAAHERGATMVAGDSGPAHVAASVGLPVRLIAGPEDPAATGPWPPRGGPHRVARDVAGPWVRRPVDDVTVDDVLAELS